MIEFINIARAAEEAVHETAVTETVKTSAATEHAPEGVAGTLGLNATYFVGQLITFSILLFILWKWVFTPVAKKLTERTERVEKAMRDAASTEKEKQEFEKWKNTQMSSARQTAAAIVAQAQNDATKAKEVVIQQTKDEQQKLMEQAKNQMQTEKSQMMQEAKGEIADIVTMATEKILKQKMDNNKDQEMVKELLKSL